MNTNESYVPPLSLDSAFRSLRGAGSFLTIILAGMLASACFGGSTKGVAGAAAGKGGTAGSTAKEGGTAGKPANDGGPQRPDAHALGDAAPAPAPDASGTPVGSGASVTKTIDNAGGTITLTDGSAGPVTLVIPAGVVTKSTAITITETTQHAPAGYTAYSPVYKFEPEGLEFAQPLAITLPFKGDMRLATLFWSRQGTTGYARLGGLPSATTLAAPVSHFSTGFIADGVDYTDPPDQSCTVTRVLQGRTSVATPAELLAGKFVTGIPSSVALFFTVDDCQGRPITGLGETDFAVKEDAAALSSEAVPTILKKPGLTIFASLLLDMSSSTQSELQPMIDAAKAFVNRLQANNNQLGVQISIQLFSGAATLSAWQAPTLDTTTLLSKLDALTTYTAADPSSTNLYGAVTAGLTQLTAAELAFEKRNAGGALTSGYLVLFTDGADTSGLVTKTQALAAVAADTKNQVLAVGLKSSPDYSAAAEAALSALAGDGSNGRDGLISSDAATTLARDFEALAARIGGQVTRTYLLGYCSPKRAGQHTVSVAVAASATPTAGSFAFAADGFTAGCSKPAFTATCPSTQTCGGLGCGACDDRVAACSGSNTCASFCSSPSLHCGGTVITNAQGYSQTCSDSPTSTLCTSTCKNLQTDLQNCGACGAGCSGGSCTAGACVCPGTDGRDCSGVCKDVASDLQNCGACGAGCGGGSCAAGVCVCPGTDGRDCTGVCKDVASDPQNCGVCGTACSATAGCLAGACIAGCSVCTADYPCAAFGSELTCRGQFADWTPADSPATFTVNGNGTVTTDSRSGLIWQQTVDANSYTWANAKTYCTNLSLVGTGWRLPTIAELESIVDFGRYYPTIDPTAFPSTPPSGQFWSSSPSVGSSGSAWYVSFYDGNSLYIGTTVTFRVRCVR